MCNKFSCRSVIFICFLITMFCQLNLSNCVPLDQTKLTSTSSAGNNKDGEDESEYYGNISKDTIAKVQKCEFDIEAMSLCMRCAKETKSEIVYPMCCANEEDVKSWCQVYIYYGMSK